MFSLITVGSARRIGFSWLSEKVAVVESWGGDEPRGLKVSVQHAARRSSAAEKLVLSRLLVE